MASVKVRISAKPNDKPLSFFSGVSGIRGDDRDSAAVSTVGELSCAMLQISSNRNNIINRRFGPIAGTYVRKMLYLTENRAVML